jgi:hypothetical protein
MPADLLTSWVPNLGAGTPFPFTGAYAIAALNDSGIERRIPAIETGGDGEFASSGLAVARTVTIDGFLAPADSNLDTLRTQLQALGAALSDRREGRLFGHSDRFMVCRVARLDIDPDDGLPTRKWRATFRASGVPFWQDAVENSYVAAAGSITYPALGTVPCPVRLEIVVTTTGAPAGTINIDHPYGTATIRPSAVGTYVINGAAGTVTRGGSDAIADFYGVFPKIDPAAGALVVTTSSGAAYSDATAYARPLYETL